MTAQLARYVVDRREGAMLVVEDAAGGLSDVPANDLPSDCRAEGSVLDVPLNRGVPQWASSKRNRAEERRIVTELGKRMDLLRRNDPGGDVEL